jgi:signal transduction histidine kinase
MPFSAVGANPQKVVLLLYDARADMQSNVFVDHTIRGVLNPQFNTDVDIRSEYFELAPLTTSDYPLLATWLRRKYLGVHFDVVAAVGGNSLRFVHDYNEDLFSGAQVVYWGRRPGLASWKSGPPMTGVVAPGMDTCIKDAFRFVVEMQPDLEQLIIVSGNAELDRQWEAAAHQELPAIAGRVALTYLSALTLEDVQSRLLNLPKRTAVLFLTMNEDAAGRRLFKGDVLTKLVQMASAPVYSTSSLFLDTGIVGGSLVSQENMSIEAAGLIARLLRGESIREMPIRESAPAPMVNWRGLSRWNLRADRIPPGTVIINRQPSLLTQYKWDIIGVVFLCTLEGVLIVALLVHRASRRRAETAMKQSQRLLQSAIDALDARVALLDNKGTLVAVNETWRLTSKVNGNEVPELGRNYLELCDVGAEGVRSVPDGIRKVLSGELKDFRCVYPEGKGSETSWFQVRVNQFHIDGVLWIVVAHENVTEIKQAHDAQQQLTGLLLRTQDDTRRQIARDLHDVTVQDLAAIQGDLTRLQRASEKTDHDAQDIIEESISLCDRIVQQLRTQSYLLHPPLLDEAGLLAALHLFVRGFTKRSGIEVELLIMEDIPRFGVDAETALFRVVQECLTNIHRHSGSKSAVIWITREEGTIRVQITDDGRGFSVPAELDTPEASLTMGVGIMGMRQRLKQLGGTLVIESSSDGTTINARVPIEEDKRAAHSSGG